MASPDVEGSSYEFADFFDIDSLQDPPPPEWESLDAAAFQESETPWATASISIDDSSKITSETNPFDIFDPRKNPRSSRNPVTQSGMQDWMLEYLNRMNDSVDFDPLIKPILSTFINNFYGLATSLVNLLVDNAVSEAINRESDVVEPQDFTFLDFDLRASNINPVSAQIRYKLKDMRDDFIEKETKKPTKKIPAQSSISKAVKANNNKRKLSRRQEEFSYTHSSAFPKNTVRLPARKYANVSVPSEAAHLEQANAAAESSSSSMKLIDPYTDMTTSKAVEGDMFPEQSNLDTNMQISLTKSRPRPSSSTSMPPPQRISLRFQTPCDEPFSSMHDYEL